MPSTPSLQMRPMDRRSHRRAPLQRELQALSVTLSDGMNVLDVSEGGVRLQLPESTSLASSLEFIVPLLGRDGKVEICQVKGEIVRRQGRDVGVRFQPLLPRHFLQLRDYVWRARAPSR
jgi:hypothetical protein